MLQDGDVAKTGLIGECRSCREIYEGAGSGGNVLRVSSVCGQVCDTRDIVEYGPNSVEEARCLGPNMAKGK
jgi:hypothetical protein